MNILFVNNFRGRGGGEEFLGDLLPGLIHRGVKVGLVCRPGTPLVNMFHNTAIHLYPLSRSGKDAFTSVFKIGKIIRDEGYEIINIQRGHDIIQSWVAALLSRTRPFLMYTSHVPKLKKFKFLLRRMDSIVTFSRHIADTIASCLTPRSRKVHIIHHGIDLNFFSSAATKKEWLRGRFSLAPTTKIIGTVGDLWKNQIEFLDGLVEIRKKFPDTKFAMVASETGISEVQEFKDRAADMGLSEAVLWAGRLSKDEMRLFYSDIDIAVSTHRKEGFGIWILEALAMGKPVVAFNAGGIRDSLESCSAGVLVNGGAKEMAREIVRILQDETLYRQMANAGPPWVEQKFAKERMIQDYYKLFQELLDRS